MKYLNNERMILEQSCWYEGADLFAPSTNNGCEGFNSYLKKYFEFKRLDVKRFIHEVIEFLHLCSLKEFSFKPIYESEWINSSEDLTLVKSVQNTHGEIIFWFDDYRNTENKMDNAFVFNVIDITMDKILNSVRTTEFKNLHLKFPRVTLKSDPKNIREFACSCIVFVKKKRCSHVFFILKKLKLLHYINLPLKGPKKRGRPKKETMRASSEFYKNKEK